MKAVVRTVYGSPEVLSLEEVERPVPRPDEVLIRVRATSLNASDWEMLRGKPLYGRMTGLFRPGIKILGSDVAGTVEEVGSGAVGFAPGDEVYGDIFERWGGFAQWVCAPVSMLRPKPGSMSFEQAAALPQSGVIALQGLADRGRLQPGQSVLINGAGGGGGTFAIQIAKLLGAEVTAVDNEQKLALMAELGADHVVDFAQQDVTQNRARYDLILDLVGHHRLSDFRRSLAPGGRYLLVGGSMGLLLNTLFAGSLVSLLSRRKMGILALQVNQGLDVLEEHFASGAVVPVIDRCYPLAETPAALRRLGEGRALGKLIITMER